MRRMEPSLSTLEELESKMRKYSLSKMIVLMVIVGAIVGFGFHLLRVSCDTETCNSISSNTVLIGLVVGLFVPLAFYFSKKASN